MHSLSRLGLLLLSSMLVCLVTTGTTRGQDSEGKSVTFNTFDGVEISGTLYSAGGKKRREAVVLLIPNFDLKKGGDITKSGWAALAKALSEEGYTVLSFDFRGFGASKTITDPTLFWNQAHNGPANVRRKGGAKLPTTIDYKDFQANYAPYLANDIAAAKAFLDRENDRQTCNTSSLIVIGAGQGATLGAMWLAHECRRRKDKNPLGAGVPTLGDSEGKYVAGAVWLTIAPSLSGTRPPVSRWVSDAGRVAKIPIAFITGKNDATGSKFSTSMVHVIKGSGKKDKDYELTGSHEIPDTKLTADKLLEKTLDTEKWIIKNYLSPVMEKRGNKERFERKAESSRYYYANITNGLVIKLNKPAGIPVPSVDVNLMLNLR